MNKHEIAEVLEEIGLLLELQGENPFKTRAYQAGARALEAMEADEFTAHMTAGTLGELKGFGEALVDKIGKLHATGRLEFYDKLRAQIPDGVIALLEVPGLGPKKIKALREQLGVESPEALAQACRDGRVAALAGFGEKTQTKLLEGLANREAYGKRHRWWDARAVAQPIVHGLRLLPEVERAEAAGSLRRNLETVGDLDFIVAARATNGATQDAETLSKNAAAITAWFCGQPDVKEVTARGETKASVRFASGLQADLRIVPAEQFAFALHHFTGSKDHNVAMRQRALARGLSLSEWGLVPEAGEGTAKEKAERGLSLKAENEAELFAHLGLAFVPPELREGLGEIEVAEQAASGGCGLPRLVEAGDLRGAFHNHTTESDGKNPLIEMAMAAEAMGWEYLGIADHSKSSVQARGLDEARLAAQVATIRALNASGRCRTQVLAGVECDILPDGRLDYSDEAFVELGLDYVVASVHSAFTQDEDEMTRRIVRAIEHPRTTMLGHATGRLLLRREGYKLNLAKVIDAAIANRVVIELNAHPSRLDLDWRLWRRAAERGLRCAINPDAHDIAGLRHVEAGVRVARKGWLTPEHVLNTRDLAGVRRWLEKRE
ncbi:MAG: DNA polymerase/3'-5' exonuclease PolX [Opitutaceae bacterium]|jgi:DNA polymerase (family 10)|nr:DNA polymerase/3'-5' exonuclease PolX [Opitutaceae bacterium]